MNGRVNGFKHTVHVAGEIIVPEANDAIARRFEPVRARCIARYVLAHSML